MAIWTAKEFLSRFTPGTFSDFSKMQDVLKIIRAVREKGDEALRSYSLAFDGVVLKELEVPRASAEKAWATLEPELQAALVTARDNIVRYQRSIRWTDRVEGELFQKIHPVRNVGIYVPGGKAAYPSTVLHTAVLAKEAGVGEIIVVTPPQKAGINRLVLAASALAGVDRIFMIGGAQAIAALAYGTETLPRVDKIVGPGNQYVAMAKKLVYGDVGIDSIAGPSEIVVVIDDKTDPQWAALDLLAQSEHDELARTFLLSESREALEKVETKVQQLNLNQPRKGIIDVSLKQNHHVIWTGSRAETIRVVNFIAGEHVSIQTEDAEDYVDLIDTAGALFIGPYAPEAIGDYSAGPSHVLPTGGNARFASGLSINDFLRTNSVLKLSEKTFRKAAPAAMALAGEESLEAHRDSVAMRYQERRAPDDLSQ